MKRRYGSGRAVSPVIATILLVAITVLLSASVAAFALGGDIMPERAATTASFDVDTEPNQLTVTVDSTTSNTTLDILVNGEKIDTWEKVSAGEAQRLNCLREGDTVRIVERKAGSDTSYVTKTYTIEGGVSPPGDCPRHATYLDTHPAASTFVDLDGWGTSGGGQVALVSDVPGGEPREGSNVMRVRADSDNSWSGAYTFFNEEGAMDVEAGQTYTVSAWVYIPEGTTLQDEFRFHPRIHADGPTTCCHMYSMQDSSRVIDDSRPHGEWFYVYYVYETDENLDDPEIRLSLISSGDAGVEGPIYVDSVKVAEGDRVLTDDEASP